jgi:hypothetical protein
MMRRLRFGSIGALIGLGLGLATGEPEAIVPYGCLGAVIGFFVSFTRSGRKRATASRAPVPPMPGTGSVVPPMPVSASETQPNAVSEADGLLADALDRRVIDAATHHRLSVLLEARRGVARGAPRPGVVVPPMPGILPAPDRAADAWAAGQPVPASAPARVGEGPSPFARRLRAIRDLIASDLAVHGLTYLGVLLLFAGAFGFVLFSFGSVQRSLRPVAEVAAPAVLLASARFLRRRGAPFVATALGLLGGVLLPLFLFASFVDEVALPPDLTGGALISALAGVSIACAGGYAWYAMRVPDASVRYLVAPSLWLAVWAVALVTAELPGGGYSLRHWSATQLSIVAAAIAATAIAVRVRPEGRFSTETGRAVGPGVAVAYLLTVALAAGEGWPSLPVVVAGLAALVVSEVVPVPAAAARVIQPLVLGGTVVALAPDIGSAWAGVVGAIAFIVLFEWLHRRRPGPVGAIGTVVGVGLSLAACTGEPWATLAGFGAASAWAHARRMKPPAMPGAADVLTGAAAGLPVGAAIGLVMAVPDGIAATMLASIVAATSAVARRWRPRDGFLGWWVAVASAAVVVGSTASTVGTDAAAAAAGLAALALLFAPTHSWVRGWAAPVATAWAVVSVAEAIGVGPSGRALGIAALGSLLVVLSGLGARPIEAHLGGAGLMLAALGLALPATGWGRIGVLGAWVAAAGAATVWSEVRDTGPIGVLARMLERAGRQRIAAIARSAPVVGAAVALPFLGIGLGAQTGITGARRSWNGVVVATVSVIEALAARALAGRRAAPTSTGTGRDGSIVAGTAAVAAFFTTLVGVSVAAPDPWPTIETLLAPVAVTLILGGELRRPAMTWVAWLASGALAVLLAERAGTEPRDLWIASFAWGAVTLVGGLALDSFRAGGLNSRETVRTTWLRTPVVLGALAVPGSLAFAFRGSPEWYGGWSLVAAVLYLTVAAQLRAGSVAAAGAALGTVAAASLVPTSPMDEPLLFVPWAAVLASVAVVMGRLSRERDPWTRWDAGLLIVAHGVALVALARALALDEVVLTWTAFGVLALVLASVLRRVEWAVGGAVLLVIAAADAGPGWLALALAASSIACGVGASRSAAPVRWRLQAAASVLAAGSWERFLEWTSWNTSDAVVATAVLSAMLLVVPAVLLKRERLALDWALGLTALGLAGASAAAIVARLPESGMTPRAAGLVAAAGTAALAIAVGASASRLQIPWQRETSAIIAVAAALQVGAAIGSSRALGAAVSAGIGLVAVLVWIWFWHVRPDSPWLAAVGLIALAADLASLALATSVLPRRDVLEAALVLTGVECAVAGVALRRPHLVTPAPVFVCAAWLVFAADAFRGEVQWFTVPSGVALLAVTSIERRARRILERTLASPDLLVTEYLGMTLVVGAALVETIAIGPLRGLIAVAAAVGLGTWGALSRVRRRVWFAAAAVLVAVALMLGGPLARLVPRVRGPALWGLLAAAGLVLIVAATLLERGRARVGAFIRRLDQLMEGWE